MLKSVKGRRASCLHCVRSNIGADFHRAEEKLLKGRRPVRNWIKLHWQLMIQMLTPYDIKLVFVQKNYICSRKISKTDAARAALFDYNMHQIVCRLGLCPRPPLGEPTALPRSHSCIQGTQPTSKGKAGERGERREGVRPLPYEENKKLSYRRGTARCVVSIEILSIAKQQCRNYLYDKS